jgi:hypothetical protein
MVKLDARIAMLERQLAAVIGGASDEALLSEMSEESVIEVSRWTFTLCPCPGCPVEERGGYGIAPMR